MGVFVDEGLPDTTDLLVNTLNGGDYSIGLYQNNLDPDSDTVWTDLTICTFTGFAEQVISGVNDIGFTAHVDYIEAGPFVFTRNAGATSNTVYGWYIRNTVTGNLWLAELSTIGPIVMSIAGTTYTVTVTVGTRDIVNA